MLALDLDVIEAVRQFKALDLGALGVGGAVGHQRQLDAARLQGVDRVMRAGKHEHLLVAIGGQAVGEPDRKIDRQRGMAGGGKRGKSVLDDELPRFGELQSPAGFRRRPELAAGIQHRRGDLLRRQRRQLVGEFRRDLVPGDLGAAIGRQDGVVHVDQHRAGQLRHRHGHFTSGGIDDRIESTLPPVFSPKMVPRS